MKKQTVFWDVDTQFDFMQPQGNLYVPEAEQIIDKVSQVRRFALDNGYSIIADVDWHSEENEEISDDPDFKETFPPHCLAGSKGSERVGDLGNIPIDYIENNPTDEKALRKLVVKDQFHIVIRKESLDAFENPNTDKLLEIVAPKTIVAFGVALDCCVSCVLNGLAKHGGIKMILLKDVTKGLGTRPEEEIYAEFEKMGVEIAEFDDLKGTL
jgi:nicotinamidase/pyrazinamidase